jgi:hypothetical protein
VNVFQDARGYVIPLTYGRGAEWVRNVLARGACTLETRGRRVRLSQPRVFRDERRSAAPPLVRTMLRVLHVADFLRLAVERDSA